MRKKGFTFIELLITMVIIMIIAMLAIPSLRERKMRANADVASQVLFKDSQFMEKWYTLNGHYNNNISKDKCPNLPYRFSPESSDKKNAYYFLSSYDNECSSSTFELKARPICGRVNENQQCVCLDNHSNLMFNASLTCNKSNLACSCINEADIPDDSGNVIDDENEDGELNPPYDDETDIYDFCTKNPSIGICNTEAICSKYPELSQCDCVNKPTQDKCKNPENCSAKPYLFECKCAANPTDPLCQKIDPNYCTEIAKWTPEQCSPKPDPGPTPDPTPTPPKPDPTPTPTPEDEYSIGSMVYDSLCGNQYKCVNTTYCNNKDPKYAPTGKSGILGWELVTCTYFGGTPNPSAVNTAILNSKVLMSSCNKFICSDNGGGQSNQCAKNIPSGIGNSYWTQCYSGKCSNPATPTYKTGDVIYDATCQKKYKCLNAVMCNSEENIAPGDDSTVWSLTNQ